MSCQILLRSVTLTAVFTVLWAFELQDNWLQTKHKTRHERHKRQQFGFYYHQNFTVGPHDESTDAGSWGPWTEQSECSRPCGGGVAFQTRICLDVRSDGSQHCIGPSKRYFSCNVQDCPEGTKDFREMQCARFNTVPFENKYYSWVPYTKAPKPCVLNCKPQGERFYYAHDTKVIDGTRCRDDSLDVCVDGVCMPVGCDRKLGSEAKEDKCRVCGGDGSSCRTIEGVFDFDNLQVGYNDILLIPPGATNINIEEKYPTSNYLAVRNKTGHYYLNGNWRIEAPRDRKFAGALFHYERKHQDYLTPERLWTTGPTKEAIFIVLLYQEKNEGVVYEYSIPMGISNLEPDTYTWTHGDYAECSVTCGGGIQTRPLRCARSSDYETVDEYLCDPNAKPAENRSCNEQPCNAKWSTGEWLECVGSCGHGKQFRTVTCQQQKESGVSIFVGDEVCAGDEEKPAYVQDCVSDIPCPEWKTGPWSACNKPCDDGLQTRKVTCFAKSPLSEKEGELEEESEILEESLCKDVGPKPEDTQTCNSGPCEGVEWIVSDWTGCSTCGLFMESRESYCSTEGGSLYPGAHCDDNKSPAKLRKCEEATKCTAMWHASEWSDCSAKCGVGVQTRVVFCGEWENDVIKKVGEEKCDASKKMNIIQNCTQPACEGQWFTGPYGRCTAPCAGGYMKRPILCIHDEEVVEQKGCDPSGKPLDQEDCNMKPCDDDEVMVAGGCKDTKHGCCPDGLTKAGPNFEGCPKIPVPEGGCEATEFGCCNDGITPALGSFKKGCPPIRTCNDTKFGCCPDGVTAAKDAEQTDCPEVQDCNESLWGCCPDLLIPAVGPNNTGCDSTPKEKVGNCEDPTAGDYDPSVCEGGSGADCFESPHGCCPDGLSTATGPNNEGCAEVLTPDDCNNSTFGCCPDGVTASPGVNGTGCDEIEIGSGEPESLNCTDSFFGCCEDNVTHAKGPNFEGCAGENCTVSEYGCCPDNLTFAAGPDFTGCDDVNCTDTEFGCCPDNITIASGPNNEGCNETDCNISDFGCCPDNMNAATGPDSEGCEIINCTTSEFGCCPDNVTLATGPEEEGCEPAGPTTTLEPAPCLNMAYGCCPDGRSPARGDNYYGCCFYKPHGCCPDNITDAMGPNYAGCGCHTSKFGCCPDNIHLAKGPRYYGCTCETYPFGCCQDNYYPAQGENYEGCYCTHMLYGCCSDGSTPASGPDQEGCGCSTTQFGCCADGTTSAQGPRYEGCPCKLMPFGCCPDGLTVARGSSYEGCPCTSMEFGCCPDNHTPATGPNREGCECENTIYGCCPDGQTSAIGPGYYGCPCDSLTYGCCPDRRTPARGPKYHGCPCETSPYGCCPDGTTLSQGPNQEGCTTAPKPDVKIPGEVCSLTQERGPCANYTVKWFFDMNFGGCSRFWYGGCQGNGNNFNTQDDCEEVCVSAEGSDACRLPKVVGSCKEFQSLWYHDIASGTCEPFEYGGCLGNSNRFPSQEACLETCVAREQLSQCEQPAVAGPCTGYFSRFYYSKSDGRCKPFTYSGCKGNDNNFETERECMQTCATGVEIEVTPSPSVVVNTCTLPKDEGPCSSITVQWYYNGANSRCEQFYYGGCEGNANRFENRNDCERSCVPTITESAICLMPYEAGNCSNFGESWYYDHLHGICRRFWYSGCGGNKNNFNTYQECESLCGKPTSTEHPDGMFKTEYCSLDRDPGPCATNELRWYYDKSDGVCKEFYYGGCDGNQNRFRSRGECETNCAESQDICQLPEIRGPCSGNFTQWHYRQEYDECHDFSYGGCQGNANRFNDKESCEMRCKKQIIPPTTISPSEKCYLPSSQGPCLGYVRLWYFNSTEYACKQFIYGGCEGNSNRFETIDECESNCLSVVPPPASKPDKPTKGDAKPPESGQSNKEICRKPVDPGPCQEMQPRWFYDAQSETCLPFVYGGCRGNKNRFKTAEICMRFCNDLVTEPGVGEPEVCPANNCAEIWCPYGVEEEKDEKGCVSCVCHNPCKNVTCPQGQKCALESRRNEAGQPYAVTECRYVVKPGQCPPNKGEYVADQPVTISRPECQDYCREDSDCRSNLKCCFRECAYICVSPLESENEIVTLPPPTAPPTTTTTTTIEPDQTIPRPEEYPEEKELPTIAGSDITIQCRLEGYKIGLPLWTKDSVEIDDGTSSRFEIQADGSLYITKVQETDSGVYTCTVQIRNLDRPASKSYRLVVHVPASILTGPSVVIATLGEPSLLVCNAIGSPLPSVSWYRGRLMLPYSSSRYQQYADFSLLIRAVTPRDLGVYVCQAFNGLGPSASASIKLKLSSDSEIPKPRRGPPKDRGPRKKPARNRRFHRDTALMEDGFKQPWLSVYFIVVHRKSSESLSVDVVIATPHYRVGSPIQLDCRIKGHPETKTKWFYANGTVPLATDEHYEVLDNHSLIIHNASIHDSGYYRCLANNILGEASSTVAITIEEIFIPTDCTDNPLFAKCELIVKAKYCNSPYYGRYCCRTCLLAGQQVGRARTPYS